MSVEQLLEQRSKRLEQIDVINYDLETASGEMKDALEEKKLVRLALLKEIDTELSKLNSSVTTTSTVSVESPSEKKKEVFLCSNCKRVCASRAGKVRHESACMPRKSNEEEINEDGVIEEENVDVNEDK